MKYLQDYMSERQTAAFEKAGAFFAFGQSQFDEKKVEGVTYVNLNMGMLCPKDTAKTLLEELDVIYRESIQQDIAENGLNKIIIRELNNHECYYTGDYQDCVDKLEDYPITAEDVRAVFNNKNHDPEVREEALAK